ncbi:MAG: hypothetical protein V7731_09575 [Amphritea sp.]
MEFVVVFAVSLVVLLVLVAVLFFSRVPSYRPSRYAVLNLLKGVATRSTSSNAWALFVGTPIFHDSELEAIRSLCFEFDEGVSDFGIPKAGVHGYLYNQQGRDYIALLADKLEKIIATAPVTLEL